MQFASPKYIAAMHSFTALDALLADPRFDKVEEKFFEEYGKSAYTTLLNAINCLAGDCLCDFNNCVLASRDDGTMAVTITHDPGLNLSIFSSVAALSHDDYAGVLLMASSVKTNKSLMNAFVRVDGVRKFFTL